MQDPIIEYEADLMTTERLAAVTQFQRVLADTRLDEQDLPEVLWSGDSTGLAFSDEPYASAWRIMHPADRYQFLAFMARGLSLRVASWRLLFASLRDCLDDDIEVAVNEFDDDQLAAGGESTLKYLRSARDVLTHEGL